MGLFDIDFIDQTVEINAPVDEVFDLFTNVEGWSAWAKGLLYSKMLSSGEMREGSKLLFVPKLPPAPVVVPVIEFVPNMIVAWGIEHSLASMVHEFEFAPVDEDSCTVRQREYATGPIALLTRPAKWGIKAFDKAFLNDLSKFFA